MSVRLPRRAPARAGARPRRSSAPLPPDQIARLDQLLAEAIEFVPSPEFNDPQNGNVILAAPPAGPVHEAIDPPAETPPYLASLYRIPLLTPQQEFHLFRQMNFYKHRAHQAQLRLRTKPSVAVMDRLEHDLSAAARLRNQIVSANLRLVVSIAKTVADSANRLDDLVSDGNVPLLRAVEIFDFTRGLRFSTYATWAIRHCLFRSAPRNRQWQKRYVTGVEELFYGVQEARADELSATQQLAHQSTSVQRLLEQLEPRDRAIVRSRFGIGGDEPPRRFREIASRLKISTERVRQLLARALLRLRESAEEMAIDVA